MGLFRPLDSKANAEFYDDLAEGKENRSLWGMEKRFSPDVAIGSASFARYFVERIEGHIKNTDKVLDLGCGTGMYHPLLAPLCGSLTGVELSPKSAEHAAKNAQTFNLDNVSIAVQSSDAMAFPDNHFDAAICLDVLHHVHDLDGTLAELKRVVKPGGTILIFEPNCVNPALLLMCILDRNEWGAVSRCYRGRYTRLFSKRFEVKSSEYNGLLIGPQGSLATSAVSLMLESPLKPLLQYFSPKLFFQLQLAAG